MEKTKLICKILSITELRSGYGNVVALNYNYGVFEKGVLVAEGTSSNEDWVRHDAGGYHTKKDFDKKYPNGWEIEFDFENPELLNNTH